MGMGGLGTTVAHSGGTISGVLKVKPPETSSNDISVPAALDAADFHKGHLPGSDDTNECTFSVPYAKTLHATLVALRRSITLWTITMPDGATWSGNGYVSKVVKSELDADAPITTEVTIQPTAAWTFTAGA